MHFRELDFYERFARVSFLRSGFTRIRTAPVLFPSRTTPATADAQIFEVDAPLAKAIR